MTVTSTHWRADSFRLVESSSLFCLMCLASYRHIPPPQRCCPFRTHYPGSPVRWSVFSDSCGYWHKDDLQRFTDVTRSLRFHGDSTRNLHWWESCGNLLLLGMFRSSWHPTSSPGVTELTATATKPSWLMGHQLSGVRIAQKCWGDWLSTSGWGSIICIFWMPLC